ncbi:MAG: hypothetical protein AB2693_27460, partial [Candidatus Thiodiazotropha sp.]
TAPTCADDVAAVSDRLDSLQSMISTAVDYSIMELYLIQPEKSVILPIHSNFRKSQNKDVIIYAGSAPMPVVSESMHMGILRSANSQESAVQENIKKARRTIHSLMGAGLHGENGLDPDTSIHLLQIYVIPVLLYGLEVVLPKGVHLDRLERVHKGFIKQILSLPQTVADPAVYILSGAIPVEAVIHKRALTFYGSICRLDESTIEKTLARRQLCVKSYAGNSWFVEIRRLCVKYGLADPYSFLDCPPSKYQWKRMVREAVNTYWASTLKERAALYQALDFLHVDNFWPGKKHPIIMNVGNVTDIPRIHTKLKMVTGTYVLQSNRASFNQNQVDATCQLCHQADETISHFLLDCSSLETTRQPILGPIIDIANRLAIPLDEPTNLLQLVLDRSRFAERLTASALDSLYTDLDMLTRRFCHKLHTERYKRLSIIPKRKRNKRKQ